jgi:hypothetical protein
MWRLNCDLIVTRDGTILLMGRKTFALDKKATSILLILQKLTEGVVEAEFTQLATHTVVGPFLQRLQSLQLLKTHDAQFDGTALERSAAFLQRLSPSGESAMANLTQLRVAILGCGGVGANIAYYLVGSGVRQFLLLDSDCVESSNLNRQHPFTSADIGQPKVAALARHLRSVQPQADIIQSRQRLSSVAEIAKCLTEPFDLIVCALDDPPVLIKHMLTSFALENESALVFGGAGYDTVNIGPLLTSTSAKQSYLLALNLQLEALDPSRTQPLAGSLPSVNSLLTAYMANQIIAHFSHIAPCSIVNREVVVNPWDLAIVSEVNYA